MFKINNKSHYFMKKINLYLMIRKVIVIIKVDNQKIKHKINVNYFNRISYVYNLFKDLYIFLNF